MASVDEFRADALGHPGGMMIVDRVLEGMDFSGLRIDYFSIRNSTFRNCDFRKIRIQAAVWGGGGPAVFEDCVFDGARIVFNVDSRAVLHNCSFRGVVLSRWGFREIELVGCTFTGRLRDCIFNGRASYEPDAPANTILDNDFSRAEFITSEFRWGVDLTRQRLPEGLDVFYTPDAAATITAAQNRLDQITDTKLRKNIEIILRVLAKKPGFGQEQLFTASRSFTGKGYREKEWPVLRALLAGDDPNNPPRPAPATRPARKKPAARKKKPATGPGPTDPDITALGDRLHAATGPARRDEAARALTGILKDPATGPARRDQATRALTGNLPAGTPVTLDLSGARLGPDAVFTGARFAAGSVFTGLTAPGDLTLTGCTFDGGAAFTDLTVAGALTVTDCTINGPTDFARAELTGPASLAGTRFEGPAVFDAATFTSTLDLTGAQFRADTSLEADFNDDVIFDRTMFEGNAKRGIPPELGYENQGLPAGAIWGPTGPAWEE
ncbi:pentapeptide repeat-containing protein [Propionibacterium acidifaciens]|uniref:pentapeptide repeat-containing protein n=1 Tax=Propionibacterium acidifaciens TaxID=556499 RepID=UPI0028F15D5E|nr:pentapeptide repeat-containing protein [Propionibacterium acidifaciens]